MERAEKGLAHNFFVRTGKSYLLDSGEFVKTLLLGGVTASCAESRIYEHNQREVIALDVGGPLFKRHHSVGQGGLR